MQKAMIDFADGGRENGLLLIGSPTAAGKTYSAANFISEEYRKNPTRKIFYLTTLKANISGFFEEVREAFERAHIKDALEDVSLILYANFDCVISAFKDKGFLVEISDEKYKRITDCREYVTLFRAAKGHIALSSGKLGGIEGGTDILSQSRKAVEDAERSFRAFLTQIAAEFGKTPSERFDYIKRVYPALMTLYPAMKTMKRSIFFMTIDKFYLGNNTVIEPSYKFISNEIVKGAVVIVDEIDSCKTSLLHQQIRESDRYKVDPIGLVKTLGAQLHAIKLRKSMLALPSTHNPENDLTPERCVADIKRFVDGTYATNHLEYALKLDDTCQDHGAPFVFKDDGVLTIGDPKKTEVYVAPDNSDNCNFIRWAKKVPDGAIPLMRYLLSINNCVSSFVRESAVIAEFYRESQNEKRREQGRELLDLPSATSSVLGAFELSPQQIDALNYTVAAAAFEIKTGEKKGDLLYYDFYQEGFTFFGFRDELSNDLRTTVNLIQLRETPEYFLYRLASQAKVIGLSATCLIDSPISNFDLDYVRSNLGDAYVEPTPEDLERMRTHFVENRQKENKAQIRVVPCRSLDINFEDEEDLTKTGEELFKSEKTRAFFLGKIMTRSKNGYARKQVFKVLQAIEDFYLDDKVRSLIIMRNNSLAVDGESLYSVDTIKNFIKMVGVDRQVKKTVKVLPFASANSAEIKRQMSDAIRECEKVIIVTTYPSAGIGHNLQFVFSDESDSTVEGEETNDNQREEDINCIYLEKPTHILVNVHPNEHSLLETSDLLEAVYQYKAMNRVGELSRGELFSGIKAAVRRTHFRNDGKDPTESNYQPIRGVYERPAVSKAALKILNQAVGRICRTTKKPADSEVVVYYDEDVAKYDFTIFDGKLLNREFEALVKELRRETVTPSSGDAIAARVEGDCANIQRHLNALLSESSSGWSRRNMRQWQDIRVFCAKNPVLREKEYADLPSNFRHFYVDTGRSYSTKYWFQKLDENGEVDKGLDSFEHLRVFFEPTDGALEVSERDCGLSKIAMVPDLRSFFGEKGYAVSFKPGRYILNPIVYTNIYKGMLGEVCGRRIFECCGIQLDEIADGQKFERFDFRVHGEDVYVDFKNWHLGTTFDERKEIEKFKAKLDMVGGKVGLVVNLFHYSAVRDGDFGDFGEIMTVSGLLLDKPSGGGGKHINGAAIKRIMEKLKEVK